MFGTLYISGNARPDFTKGDLTHETRIIEYWKPGKQESVRLLTNDLESEIEWVIALYDRR